MLTLIKGSLAALKDEMKTAKKEQEQLLKSTIKSYGKKEVEEGKISTAKRKTLGEIEQRITLYNPSKRLPVWVDFIMIDFKVYSDFVKKLKGFSVSHEVYTDGLEVRYWNNNTGQGGKLMLSDLAKHFEGFSNIPVAAIQDVEEA